MGKISIDAFLREYNVAAKQKGTAMESFIKKHITTQYVDFIIKEAYCENIMKATCYKKDGERKFVKVNSASRYLFFVMRLIDLYTDIEINQDKVWEDYDKLNEVGAINTLIAAIPESEYSEFSTLLNMKMDDFRDNEYSITALLYNFKESLALTEEVIQSVLDNPKIKELLATDTE